MKEPNKVINKCLASFSVFVSSNPWQCKVKLKYMKNPSFRALHSPYQANQRCKEESQKKKSNKQAISHGCAKSRTPTDYYSKSVIL